eukprot:SAG11_NODE_285_length_11230_cov_6.339412_12_plen_148_part_00
MEAALAQREQELELRTVAELEHEAEGQRARFVSAKQLAHAKRASARVEREAARVLVHSAAAQSSATHAQAVAEASLSQQRRTSRRSSGSSAASCASMHSWQGELDDDDGGWREDRQYRRRWRGAAPRRRGVELQGTPKPTMRSYFDR